MAMMPKRVKHRKQHRGRLKGYATRNNYVAYGEYGLQALEYGWVPANVIEAARIACNRACAPAGGRVFIRVFPHKPITKKPLETRMGKGKGSVELWVAVVKAGKVLYEIEGVPEDMAREAFRIAGHKLPVPTQFMKRSEQL